MADLLQPTTLIREEAWRAASLSPNTIVRSFRRMWSEIAAERSEGNRLSKQLADGSMVRTQTVNLITLSDSVVDLDRVDGLIHGFHEFIPSRIIMLLDSHGWEDDLDIVARVEERPRPLPMSPSRLETVTVKARREQLASVVLPLLVPELPDYVWCASGNFVANELVTDMADLADRLVVDSSLAADPGAGLRYLSGLAGQPGHAGDTPANVRISDLAWTRLTPWRQMIAQFFDTADALRRLADVDQVLIEYAEPEGGRSATTAALLTAGWLATRLGWRAPGEELVRTRGGYKLTLRAGERGRSREVVLTMRPVLSPDAAPSLVSVQLVAEGDAQGAFTVRRTSPEMMVTRSETPDQPPIERTAYALNQDDEQLLSAELRATGTDRIYVDALAFAARLWPDEEDREG